MTSEQYRAVDSALEIALRAITLEGKVEKLLQVVALLLMYQSIED